MAAATRFFSLLALVAGGGAVVLVATRLMPASAVPARSGVLAQVHSARLWLAWIVAATSMVGSMYFSESQHLVPCKLCWFQRIAMYPLAIVLLIAAVRGDQQVGRYVVPIAGIGLAVSTYHYVIEWNPNLEAGSCALTAPCTVPYFREFGFVSLAFMAMCGFAAIIALFVVPEQESGTHVQHI